MIHRTVGVVLICLIAVIGLIGGVTSFRAMNQEHLGLVNALDGECYDIGGLSASTINCLITAQGSTKKTMLLGPENWVINSNVTVPANIELKVAPGAMLSVSTGITLHINGGFDAPNMQVISHLGTGRVRFGGKISRLKAVWWGVVCNNSTDDVPALNAMLASAFDGSTIELLYGVCRVSPWDIAGIRGLVFEGAGGSPIGAFAADGTGTTIKAIGTQTHVMRVMNSQYLMFRNITFDGNLSTAEVVIGEYEAGPASHVTFERCIITQAVPTTGHLYVLGRTGEDPAAQQVDYWVFREGIINQDLTGAGTLADRCVKVTGSNVFLNWIKQSRISQCLHSVEMHGGSVNLYGIDFGVATVAHIQINQGAQSFTVADSYSESAGPSFIRYLPSATPLTGGAIVYLERNTINVAQAASEWPLTQPLVMTSNNFSATAFVVEDLGDDRSRYHVTAFANRFTGDGIGFGGSGLSSVHEFLTTHISTAGVVTVQNILRSNIILEGELAVNSITIGPSGTPLVRVQGVTFSDNFGSITSGLCAEGATHPLTGAEVNSGSFFGGRMGIAVPTGFHVSAKAVSTGSIKFMVCNFSGVAADPDGAGTNYTAYFVKP